MRCCSLLCCALMAAASVSAAPAAPEAPAALSTQRKSNWDLGKALGRKHLNLRRPAHTDPGNLKVVKAPEAQKQATSSAGSAAGWLGVLGGAMCHLALGTIYCWGNFGPYAPAKFKFFSGTGAPGAQPDSVWVLPAAFVAQMLTMPIGPQIQKKFGSRGATLIGCWMMAAGVYLSSYAENLVQFMLSYSALMGAGIGIAYTAPMVNGWKWFPNKKGLVSGCVVAGFGSGGFIFNQVGSRFINPLGINADKGVYPDSVYAAFPGMLRRLATIYFVLTGVGALLITPPKAPSAGSAVVSKPATGLTLKEALNTKAFWMLWVMILGIGTSGITIAGAYKNFGSLLHPDDNFQALVGSLGALSNGAGRLFWGSALDAADFKRPFAALTTLQAATLALYTTVSKSQGGFLAATCILLFCLGGNFAMFPAYTTKLFGVKEGAMIYGVMFSAFSIASVLGSLLTKSLIQNFGWGGVFKAMSALSVLVLGVLSTYVPYSRAA